MLDLPRLDLPAGQILAITGPSGSGKSLLFKHCFGWLNPDAKPLLSPTKGHFAMIQDPSSGLTPGLSIAGHFREVGGAGWRSRAEALLTTLSLPVNYLPRMPHTLSGGERQRLMLALILLNQPTLLWCDEPVASIDAENERALWTLLLDIKREQPFTLVIITHQLAMIAAHADQVLLLQGGRRVFLGTKRCFFEKADTTHHRRLLTAWRKLNQPPTPPKPTQAQTLLQVNDLCIRRSESLRIDLNAITLENGEWVWLQGPSGSGKSSIAQAIAGLLIAEKGFIQLAGEQLALSLTQRTRQQRKAIQYIYQHGTQALNPALTVGRQLQRAWQHDPNALSQGLTALDMDDVNLDRRPAGFSLGEVQRINLLRALAAGPLLLLGDEILAPLDLALKQSMIAYLTAWREQTGAAVLMITHDPALASLLPARIIQLSQP